MKRALAVLAIVGLVLVMAPSPAHAAPSELGSCQDAPLDLLGISVPLQVCVRVDGNEAITSVVNGAGNVVDTIITPVQTVIERVEVPVPGPTPPAPAPVTVTAPAPAPVTRTVTQAPRTVTKSAIPSTATETATETATTTVTPPTVTTAPTRANNPTGQEGQRSGTVEASTPTAPAPVNPGVDSPVVPDDPEVAAFTGSLLGLFIGLVCAFLLMFIAYRRGQAAGEEKSINDFLGYIRGEPQPGRHRLEG